MAKTFDNISEALATNYLFLFAQRTLALQNEPPTPPPLNVVGLPCEAIFRLWAWLYQNTPIEASPPSPPASPPEMASSEKAAVEHTEELKAAAANVAADKARLVSSNEVSKQAEEAQAIEVTAVLKASVAVEAVGEAPVKAAATLAEKITEYILDHQDDAAQEDRWRTTMKRDMVKNFRVQREATQKVEMEVKSMQQRFDNVHSKMDEKLDRIAKDLAVLLPSR